MAKHKTWSVTFKVYNIKLQKNNNICSIDDIFNSCNKITKQALYVLINWLEIMVLEALIHWSNIWFVWKLSTSPLEQRGGTM